MADQTSNPSAQSLTRGSTMPAEDIQTPPPSAYSAEVKRTTQTPGSRRGRRRRTPGTGNSVARPDTSTSSIGEIPDRTFFPEGEDFDEEDDDYTDGEAEEAQEVFAFNRPATGALHVQPSAGGGMFGFQPPISEANEASERHSTGTTYEPPGQGPPLTANSSRPRTGFSFGSRGAFARFPRLRTGHGGRRDAPPSAGISEVLSSRLSTANSISLNDPEPNLNTAPPATPRRAREVMFDDGNMLNVLDYRKESVGTENSATRTTTDGSVRPLTGASRVSHKPSFMSTTSVATSIDEESITSSLDGANGKPGGIRMRSMTPLVSKEDLETIPGSRPVSRGWDIQSALEGSMTIPDGMTTRGDGQGRLFEKWDPERGTEAADGDLGDEDSPYPEVRASVSNMDDPEMPALTIRSWVLGIFFAMVSCAVNTFFQFRNPAPTIPPLVIQVVSYPAGKFLAAVLPLHTVHFPRWLGGFSIDLNPGPFNIKEHTCIVVMSNVSFGPVTGLHISAAAEKFYHKKFNPLFTLLMVISTQMSGLGLAGIGRRFLVYPASMIWPYNLVVATNLNAFHAEDDGQQRGMTRFRFFCIVACCAFAYYWLPGFLFTGLSYFSWVCWIKPNNVVVNQLFGVNTGLGMGVLTFDWAQVIWTGSPLTAPWWAEANVGVGFVLFYWIIVPILYYNNVWFTAYLPMSVSAVVDRWGNRYNVTAVLDSTGNGLDLAAYQAYSPVFISAAFAMTLTLAYALSTAMVTHTALNHGPRMWIAVKHVYSEPDDIHMKLMRQYKEVPDWWYVVLLALTLTAGIIAIEVFHTGLPVYGLLLAFLLPAVYFIPSGIVFAMTAQQVAINLLAELIPGYLFPNKAVANMIAKSYATETLYEAIQFTQALKLGHYIKVPPRSMFIAQVSGAFLQCFVSFAVKEWLFAVVPDICAKNQKNFLTCPYTLTYYNSSILWGVIGPGRLFGQGSMYHYAVYAAVAGIFLPIPFWALGKKYPKSIFPLVNMAVILNGSLNIPPATGINYASWLTVGFIFQYFIRRHYFAWWAKYNYTLSAALDVGTLIGGIVIFLTMYLPGLHIDWIGNTIYTKTADYAGAPYKETGPEGFGPATWS